MKKINYLFIFFAVVFSGFILLVSLQSANKARMVGDSKLMSSKFYVAKEILPDHSFYPLLMLVDRLRLELADEERRVYLLTAYAERRLFYSKKLLEKGNPALALTTLSKAVKYINQALEENTTLLEKAPLSKKEEYNVSAFFVLESLAKHEAFVLEHRDQFSNEEKVVLESLSLESASLSEKLRSLMNQSIQN